MQNYTNQIITYGTNDPHYALYPVNGRPFYECANSFITRGMTAAPNSIQECLTNYPEIKQIADAVGFTTGDLWQGNTSCPPAMPVIGDDTSVTGSFNLLLDKASAECQEIQSNFGWEWMGCIWGTPTAPYSCICPQVNAKYEAYIKLRLNDASFWATPVETPVKRAEFLDAFKYATKISVTIAGDFKLKNGQVVEVRLDALNKFGYSQTPSYLNAHYYITGIKHVITNSGTHETSLALSYISAIQSGSETEYTYS